MPINILFIFEKPEPIGSGFLLHFIKEMLIITDKRNRCFSRTSRDFSLIIWYFQKCQKIVSCNVNRINSDHLALVL